MKLKIGSSTVVFSCESCKNFKNTYFVGHWQMAASAIDNDAKYSHLGQQANTSISTTEKPVYQLQHISVAKDGQGDRTSTL